MTVSAFVGPTVTARGGRASAACIVQLAAVGEPVTNKSGPVSCVSVVRGERVADARAPSPPSATPMSRIAQPAEWFAAAMKSPEVDAKPERRP